MPVFLRSCAEVAAIAAREPFDPRRVAASRGKLQVSMLLKKPSAAARKAGDGAGQRRGPAGGQGREVYWLPSGGLLESDLDLKAIEAAVGADTRRTMGTIEQIAARHCAPAERSPASALNI